MIDYIIIGLVVCVLAFLIYKYPNKFKVVLFDLLISELQKREPFVVQQVYNVLPKQIKSNVSSKVIAEIVSFTINIGIKFMNKK